jgi:hypothetical protein
MLCCYLHSVQVNHKLHGKATDARKQRRLQTLGFLYYIIEDHDTLFILSEGCHLTGLGILIYKLQQKQSAAGAEPDPTQWQIMTVSQPVCALRSCCLFSSTMVQ